MEKYEQLATALKNENFDGGYKQAAGFFFRSLKHLETDLLLG
jgi:hypothetical protein